MIDKHAEQYRLPVWSLLAVLFLALAIRCGVAWGFGFDGLYGQDAYHYYDEGRQLAFTFKHTGTDSIGYPAMLAFITLLFGMRPEIAQIAGLLAGALTPVLIGILAWLLTRRASIAVIAGLLACAIPWHIRGSVIMMSDIPAMFWLTAGITCGVWYVQRPSWPWGMAATGALAVAVVTRYVSALAVVPVLVYAILEGRRPPWSHIIAGVAVGLLVVIPELFHMRIYIPSLFLLEGWHPLNALRTTFVTQDGRLSYDWPVAVMYLKTVCGWGFLNPVWTICALAGVWTLRAERTGWFFLMAWIVALYGFLIGLPLVNPRYLLPLIAPVCVLAGAGLVTMWDRSSRMRRLTDVMIVLGVIGLGAGSYRTVGEILERKACEREVVDWIERNITRDSLIIAFDVAHAARFYTFHRVVHLHEIDPAQLEPPPGSASGMYLIWNEALAARVAQRRPRGNDPIPQFTANYMWLHDRVRRTRIAQICDWEIVQVNAKEE